MLSDKQKQLAVLALLATATSASPAVAQVQEQAPEAISCNGVWTYTHEDKARGWPADVEITITGGTGTYVAHLGKHKARNSPCREKELPVTVSVCTAQDLAFAVDGDSLIEGCPRFRARMKRTGPDTAEGTIGRGQTVTMRRKP